jgi:hypothetical protein
VYASGSLFLCAVSASGIRKVKYGSIAERDITGDYIIAVLFPFGDFLKTVYTDIAFG